VAEMLVMERERGGKLSNWILRVPLGATEAEAVQVREKDHEGTLSVFKAWLNHETQELCLETVTPADPSATGGSGSSQLRVLVSRRSLDSNTVLMSWEGAWLGTSETGSLKSSKKPRPRQRVGALAHEPLSSAEESSRPLPSQPLLGLFITPRCTVSLRARPSQISSNRRDPGLLRVGRDSVCSCSAPEAGCLRRLTPHFFKAWE
jgi:hypothetical protein